MAFLTKQIIFHRFDETDHIAHLLPTQTSHKVYPSNQCSEQIATLTENISNDVIYCLAAAVRLIL